jgi:ureidoacrylate peracid hydrolase
MIELDSRYYRAYPVDDPQGHASEQLRLDRARTVFLLVDVYGVGFDPSQRSGELPEFYRSQVEGSREVVVDHIVPAKIAAKAACLPIVYLANHLSPTLNERSEWRNLSLRVHGIDVLTAWREPNEILAYSEIMAPGEGEYLVKKQLYSGFFETQLDSLLRSLNAYNLITVGFDSRICLAATVLDAMYRNYRVIVLRDCVGTAAEATGSATDMDARRRAEADAIRFIETNVGYTSTSQQWVEACTAAGGKLAAMSPAAGSEDVGPLSAGAQ